MSVGLADENTAARFAAKTKRKIEKKINNQPKKMPKVCQGMEYTGPKIITHAVAERDNIFVVTNELHSRHTNNGYSRPQDGKFFCH